MKKLISLALVLVLCLSASAALAEKYGLGVVVEQPTTKDASVVDGDKYDGTASYNAYVCSLVLDDEGKIVSVIFDAVQGKTTVDNEGKVTAATFISKQNVKEGYNMKTYGGAVAEWYEQANSLSAWCVGKTVDEVLGMKTYAKNEEHTCVPDEEDLKTTVTIDVSSFLASLKAAAENAQ